MVGVEESIWTSEEYLGLVRTVESGEEPHAGYVLADWLEEHGMSAWPEYIRECLRRDGVDPNPVAKLKGSYRWEDFAKAAKNSEDHKTKLANMAVEAGKDIRSRFGGSEVRAVTPHAWNFNFVEAIDRFTGVALRPFPKTVTVAMSRLPELLADVRFHLLPRTFQLRIDISLQTHRAVATVPLRWFRNDHDTVFAIETLAISYSQGEFQVRLAENGKLLGSVPAADAVSKLTETAAKADVAVEVAKIGRAHV